MRRSRRDMGGVCMQLKRFLMEEDGVGVIEVKSIFLYTKSNSFKNA